MLKKRESRKEKKEQRLKAIEKKQMTEKLMREIADVQDEMAVTLNNFSHTVDGEMLEYYMYHYKANTIKHAYLLRKLKKIYYTRKE